MTIKFEKTKKKSVTQVIFSQLGSDEDSENGESEELNSENEDYLDNSDDNEEAILGGSDEDDDDDNEINDDDEDSNEDDDDEGTDDDNDEDCDDNDTNEMTDPRQAPNQRVIFKENDDEEDEDDDDDDDEVSQTPPNISVPTNPTQQHTESEDEDSDAAPDEDTLHRDEDKINEAKKMLADTKREKRRKVQQRNIEQKVTKRAKLEDLEDRKLPDDLLSKVDIEKLKTMRDSAAPKRKKFQDDESLKADDIDESVIPLEKGVHIRPLEKEGEKQQELVTKALDFRNNQLYGSHNPRITSLEQRQNKTKLLKSGKNNFVT